MRDANAYRVVQMAHVVEKDERVRASSMAGLIVQILNAIDRLVNVLHGDEPAEPAASIAEVGDDELAITEM